METKNRANTSHIHFLVFINKGNNFWISSQLSVRKISDATSDHHVDTPILDSESTHLLQSIFEQGGYAYVRMEFRVAARDLHAGEVAREMASEQLHFGPWNSVLPV
ncbi:hypothetical protein ACFX2I_005627 [Malus domestica]